MSSESLLVELLGAGAFAFETAEVGTGTTLAVIDGFFLFLSSDESDEDDVSCFFCLPTLTGVVGAINLNRIRFTSEVKWIRNITFS